MTSFLLFKSDKQLTNSVTDEWWFVLFELKSSEKVQSSEMETAAMTSMFFFHFIIISFPDAVHVIQDPLLFPLEILCLPLYFGLAGITNPHTVVQYSVTAS